MSRDLPKRMYRHGRQFRLVRPDGSKVPLGRDQDEALRRYYVLTSQPIATDVACPKTMLDRHRKGAKQRGIEFTIQLSDVSQALEAQGGVCAVTALAFNLEKPDGLRIRPWAPSIDRINSRVGYLPGNVRIVCAFVNVAMNGFGEQFFAKVLAPLIDAAIKAEAWKNSKGPQGGPFPLMGIFEGISTVSNHSALSNK